MIISTHLVDMRIERLIIASRIYKVIREGILAGILFLICALQHQVMIREQSGQVQVEAAIELISRYIDGAGVLQVQVLTEMGIDVLRRLYALVVENKRAVNILYAVLPELKAVGVSSQVVVISAQ